MIKRIKNPQFLVLMAGLILSHLSLIGLPYFWLIPFGATCVLAAWFWPRPIRPEYMPIKTEHINVRDWVSKLSLNQSHQLFDGGDCCYYVMHLDKQHQLAQPVSDLRKVKGQNILIMEGEGEVNISGKRFAIRSGDLLNLPGHLEVSSFHPHTNRLLVLWRLGYA